MKIKKIYGAPGTGKTTDMMNRLEQELEAGTPLGRIAFVTHTVAARDEARLRAKSKIPHASEQDFKFFKTIHGICYNILGLNRANVMQSDDYVNFGDYASVPFSVDFSADVDEDGLPIGFNHSAGNEILAIRQLAAAHSVPEFDPQLMYLWPYNLNPTIVKDTLDKYDEYRFKKTKFDFVDMLQMYLRDENSPLSIDVMFIDEAQDLSKLQWAVVHKMMNLAQRVYIAGDDDQSIFGFIGADPMGFYNHPCDDVIILPKTYRLLRRIWEFAYAIIKQVSVRQDKTIQVRGEGGQTDYWNLDPSYLDIDGSKQTMIIARHHGQLTEIAQLLEKRGIPFTHKGKSIVGTERSKAIHAYFKAKSGESINVRLAADLLRMAGKKEDAQKMRDESRKRPDAVIEPGSIGLDYSVDWAEYFGGSKYADKQNYLLRLILNQQGLDSIIQTPKIDLTTYHGSKGREADHVILFSGCYRAAWEHSQRHPDEEKRLCYVGVTRAKESLTIMSPTTNLYMKSLF